MSFIDGLRRTGEVILDKPKEIAQKTVTTVEHTVETNVSRAKAFELGFTASFLAAKIGRTPSAPPTPPPAPQTPNLQSSGSGTQTTYRIGDPTRPNIRHDNGFLQNPNDPKDPKPTATVPPSQADRDYYNDQLSQVKWAQRIDGLHIPFTDKDDMARRLSDGIDAYRHFLEGNGTDRTFSYDKFVKDDPSGQTALKNAVSDTQRGAEDLYNQMIAKDPSLAGKPITFNITSGAITVGGGEGSPFPYPATENWQKAIGGHSIWNSASVTVTPPATAGGKPQFSMNYTLHAEDRYNFNPGAQDIATGVPDATRGKLEQTGLAHQYMNYATLHRDVSWTQGDLAATTKTTTPGGR